MIMRSSIDFVKKPLLAAALVAAIILVSGVLRILFYVKSPDVIFLVNRAGAQWIKYDDEFELQAKPSGRIQCHFKYVFHTNETIREARISVQALKKAEVSFDGVKIYSANDQFSRWKQVHDIKIPLDIAPGGHEIVISATSENSYAAILAYSKELQVRTGTGWFASYDGKNWRAAVPVTTFTPPAVIMKFPTSFEALRAVWPYLSVVFIMVFCFSWTYGSGKKVFPKLLQWIVQPCHVRWGLLGLWAILSINNMFKLNYQTGSDVWGHIDYIDYIATKGTLPLAPEGWQMFQAPLNYLLSAPLYAVLSKWLDLPSVVKIMTIIPVLCGLLQIEIVYRTARLVFTQRKDLQIIAVIAGSLLPVHTYVCQYVGNEPLTACLVSVLILLSVELILPDRKEHGNGYFVVMGVVWGLALLSKMTALLLAPVVLLVLIFHVWSLQGKLKNPLRPVLIVFLVPVIVAGWYYLRNYLKLGNAFMGLFDPLQMMQWWQDPGYRIWPHLLSFGEALYRPFCAGLTSFWDMFYSTLWLDGINSGLIDFIPWNENFMIAGSLLALLPGVFILTGLVNLALNKKTEYRNAVILSAASILIFLMAMIDMYIACPVYSRTKAGYTLGLLPCYVILIAAGAEPFLRHRIIRSFALAFFACWAFAAYAAYFVVNAP